MFDWLWDIKFREEWFLFAAVAAIPVFLLARRSAGRVVFSSFRLLPKTSTWRSRLAWVPDLMLALATVALAVAFAGPRTEDEASQVKRQGIAIVMVVDTSSSMLALDLSEPGEEATRLDAVKRVFRDFVAGGDGLKGRPNDAIGIVSFARYADTRCPLTLDHDTVTGIADTLKIVTEREEDGTAIGDGLSLAVERLRQANAKSKVAILLTDGVNNAGEESPVAAAKLARLADVKVYAIGAGTNGVAPVRVEDPFTGRTRLRPMPVEIDEEILKDIANETGGRYYRATDGDALHDVYVEIDRLERSELQGRIKPDFTEHYDLAVAIGLLLAALGWLIRGTVFRRLP